MRNNDKNCLIAGNNEMKKRVHFIFLKHNRKLKFMLDVSSIYERNIFSEECEANILTRIRFSRLLKSH